MIPVSHKLLTKLIPDLSTEQLIRTLSIVNEEHQHPDEREVIIDQLMTEINVRYGTKITDWIYNILNGIEDLVYYNGRLFECIRVRTKAQIREAINFEIDQWKLLSNYREKVTQCYVLVKVDDEGLVCKQIEQVDIE